jgi:hypothetical protein
MPTSAQTTMVFSKSFHQTFVATRHYFNAGFQAYATDNASWNDQIFGSPIKESGRNDWKDQTKPTQDT